MTIDHAKELNQLCADGLWMAAGTRICQILETDHVVSNNAEGLKVVQDLLQHLLDNDMYLEAATLQWGPDQFNTEPESTVRVFKAMQEGSTVLLMGASSMSKCLHPDTPVIMFDGSVKTAKEIKVGDQLMGDDSTPRKVLVANPGFGPMYRITPERGEPWECNDAHILSLRVSAQKKCGSGCLSKKWRKGDVIDIPIKQYLELSKDKKKLLKQFHIGVEFEEKPLPFDPYIYGAWIGDGGFDVPALHTPDGPMAKRWVEYFQALGYRIWSGYHDKCPMWAARWSENGKNPFLDFIRTSRINGEKTILNEYLVNSRENRLKLLAGLIDSDGWVSCKTSYQFVTKHEALANQVMRLARSLGYASTVTPRVHKIKSIGFSGTYFHVGISGVGITEIPTLEKHALEPKTKKNLCNTGFKVEPIGDEKYYGFVIDGNHRFLLGDFTVTHNTYAAGAYMLLDYLRDPFYTTVKLAAVNEDHLRKNLFAHVVNLFRSCAVPSAYEITVQDSTLWMGIKAAGYGFGISGIAFKQSQETSGQFKGYKAQPVRKKKHEKFGYLSRLRVLGDECLPYWQKIKMADGSEREIGEIVNNKITGNVLSVNNLTGIVESKKIIGWHAVPRRGRKIVGIKSGENLAFVTEDHPILTNRGYVSALQAANNGLSVATLNENISCNKNALGGTKVDHHWWASWGRINLSECRPNRQCEDQIRTRGESTGVFDLEAQCTGKLQSIGNQGSIHDGMGWGDVPIYHGMPSGVHEDLQCDKTNRREENNYSRSVGNDRPNGHSHLVSGRRWNFEKRNKRIRKNINVFISEERSGASGCQVIELRSSVSIIRDEKGTSHNYWSSRNESLDGSNKTVCSFGLGLQTQRREGPREAEITSRHDAANEENMLHLPQRVYKEKKSKNVQSGVQFETDQVSWITDAQDDEIVYCIDVEDNHNFFAGGIAVKNCQNWPSGPFKDFNSLIASKSGTELIKIACAFNPETTSVHVVQLAEPEQGWSVDDMDRLYDWSSKAGWRVCRLDAALSENVKQRVVVYPGLQTYEGFISYLKAGGDNSPNYSCFARGWPPMKGDVNTIIPPQWPQEARGEATFIENPEVFASVDLAFMGKDSAQMAIGRWGLASGWEDHMGRFQPFKDRLNSAKDKPRHVLQIDQLIPLEKHDNTVRMAEEIMGRCKMLRIDPDHVAVDKTGYGFGTWSHLCKVWGEVLGIAWNEKASELKILAEDQNGADKQCDGLMSEMWWAFRRWLDPSCRAILINPIIPPQPLHTQLTSRRYRTGAKGIKVEAKEEYKSRNQNSPDEADAVIMLVHMIRQTSDVIPGLVEHQINRPESNASSIKLYSMKSYTNVEADDSISIDGADES